MSAPVVVFGIGNRSRGDDAAGPLVVERFAARLAAEGLAHRVDCLEEYQLQPEHALDLAGRELAVFVDAHAGLDAGCRLEPVSAASGPHAMTSHALSPAETLAVCERVTGAPPPRAFVLGVAARSFGLGDRPREETRGAMDEAEAALARLCLGVSGGGDTAGE